MTEGVDCMFTCKVCGATKQPFRVRYREKDEDIGTWIDTAVRRALTAAHRAYQPSCPSPQTDLILPVNEGANGIGMRTVN